MKKKFYRVSGIDRINSDVYKLGFVNDKKKCSRYYIEGGWKQEDLVFEAKKRNS